MRALRGELFWVTLVLAAVFVLGSCSSSPRATPSTTPAATPKTSAPTVTAPTEPYGELRVTLTSFGAQSFDPVTVTTGNRIVDILSPIFDYMVAADGPNFVPSIAEKWEIAADGLSWTFRIRKGVKFSNGDDLTARDVKFSLDRFSAKEAFYAYIRDAVQRTELVDDYTVRAYTKGTQPQLLRVLGAEAGSSTGMVMPKDYVEKSGLPYFSLHPVGSGPFKLVRDVPGDMVQYEAVDKPWRVTPAFKTLTTILMPEESTRVAALKTGMADIIDIATETHIELDAAGYRTPVLSYMPDGIRLYNTYEPQAAGMPLADVRVRQALSLAINRDEIMKTFFAGKARPVFAPSLSDSSGDIDIAYWRSYSASLYRHDPEAARQLLKQAGYPNGFTFKFYSFTQSGATFQPALAEILQGYWQKIGVNAQLIPTDWGTFSPMRWVGSGANRAPNPAVVGTGSLFSKSERADTMLSLFNEVRSTGSYAAFGKAKPEMDALAERAMKEMDTAKRKDAIAQIVKAYIDSYTNIPIGLVPTFVALGPRVDITFPLMANTATFYADIVKHRR